MRRSHLDVGRQGEDDAIRWLEAKGWTVRARGARIGGVEIDILAVDPATRTLVVVEVKTRQAPRVAATASMRPEQAVNRAKIARLSRAAQCLEPLARTLSLSLRIDVLAVHLGGGSPIARRIEHFRDVTC